MKRLYNALRQPLWLSLIIRTCLAIACWFIGPVISIATYTPLASSHARFVVILLIYILWGVRVARQARPANAVITHPHKELSGANQERSLSTPTQELGALYHILRKTRIQKNVQTLAPLYLIMGAPQSGKTQVLSQMALTHTYQSQENASESLNLWSDERLSMLELGSAFLTANAQTASQWVALLQTIKRARAKGPINGVILTLEVDTLLHPEPEHLREITLSLKRRVQELNAHLGQNVPVYLLITKLDFIAGFSQFCEGIGLKVTKNILGFTLNTPPRNQNCALSDLENEYTCLIKKTTDAMTASTLSNMQLDFAQWQILFPQQLMALKGALSQVVSILLKPDHVDTPVFWRGLYFCSSTLSQSPIRWLTSQLPRQQLVVPTDDAPTPGLIDGGYFIGGLIEQRFLPDGNLIFQSSHLPRFQHQRLLPRLACLLLALILVVVVGYQQRATQVTLTQKQQEFSTLITTTATDWATIESQLTALRSLTPETQGVTATHWWQRALATKTSSDFSVQSKNLYNNALQTLLLPKLTTELRTALIKAHHNQGDQLTALKHYLAMQHAEQLDRESFTRWTTLLLQTHNQPPLPKQTLQSLSTHVTALSASSFTAPELDQVLINQVRTAIAQTPLAERLYAQIKANTLAQERTIDPLAPLKDIAERIFVRQSGKTLSEGVPSLFSYEGYLSQYLPEKKRLSKQLLETQWLLDGKAPSLKKGEKNFPPNTASGTESIEQSIDNLYFSDYISTWENYLSDLKIQSLGSLIESQTTITLLSGAASPIENALKEFYRHLALSAPLPTLPTIPTMPTIPTLPTIAQETLSAGIKDNLPQVLESSLTRSLKSDNTVAQHFSVWIDFFRDSQKMDYAQIKQPITHMHALLTEVAQAQNPPETAFQTLIQNPKLPHIDAQLTAPDTVKDWLNQLTKDTRQLLASSAASHINRQWQQQVLRPYRKHIRDQYPFNPDSKTDLPLEAFTEFFGPEGTLDTFFNAHLTPFIQPTQDHYQWIANPGLRGQSLEFYKFFKDVQATFFDAKGALSMTFWITPEYLDKAATSVKLSSGDSTYSYFHGPIKPTKLIWPQGAIEETRITYFLASRGAPVSQSLYGQWSLFRFFEQKISLSKMPAPQTLRMQFDFMGIKTSHSLHVQSKQNPFERHFFTHFDPPTRL